MFGMYHSRLVNSQETLTNWILSANFLLLDWRPLHTILFVPRHKFQCTDECNHKKFLFRVRHFHNLIYKLLLIPHHRISSMIHYTINTASIVFNVIAWICARLNQSLPDSFFLRLWLRWWWISAHTRNPKARCNNRQQYWHNFTCFHFSNN